MASDTDLHLWVSDKLHESMGMSDKHAVDYLIGLAKSTSTPDSYISKLSAVLGDDHNISSVARELWDKIPRKQKSVSINRMKEKEALEIQRKNASYQMLSDTDEDEGPPIVIKKSKKEKKNKKKRDTKERRKSSSDDESDDGHVSKKRTKKGSKSDSDGDEDLRMNDLKERDEFAARLKKRDKDKQRNLAEKSDKKAFEEARKRLQLEEEDRKKLMPELRDQARKDYIKKRKAEKVVSLKEDIEDDERMFDESELTEREKLERQYKKKIYKLATDYEDVSQEIKVKRYVMPDADQQYVDTFEEKEVADGNIVTEQHKWEDNKLDYAVMKFGSKDAKAKHLEKEKKYDLLVDEDQIAFVMVSTQAGSGETEDNQMSEKDAKKMSIAETRKSLPIFKYREDLLKAIEDHQVLIIEGTHFFVYHLAQIPCLGL